MGLLNTTITQKGDWLRRFRANEHKLAFFGGTHKNVLPLKLHLNKKKIQILFRQYVFIISYLEPNSIEKILHFLFVHIFAEIGMTQN